jgi:hypothetical protein
MLTQNFIDGGNNGIAREFEFSIYHNQTGRDFGKLAQQLLKRLHCRNGNKAGYSK